MCTLSSVHQLIWINSCGALVETEDKTVCAPVIDKPGLDHTCVCVGVRERERECVCVCACVCVCVCVSERERERECVCV